MWIVVPSGISEVEAGVEACDDGNADETDGCLRSCEEARCGDGRVQAGVEQCDDGNVDDTDACTNSCVEYVPEPARALLLLCALLVVSSTARRSRGGGSQPRS